MSSDEKTPTPVPGTPQLPGPSPTPASPDIPAPSADSEVTQTQAQSPPPTVGGLAAATPPPQVPKRRSRRGWWVAGFLITFAIALGEAVIILRQGILSPAPAAGVQGERRILYWQDPMHPAYRSDKPGKAPDCGMDLVPVYENAEKSAAAPERKVLYWTCSMHTRVKSDKPGKCPDCGMELVPVYEEAAAPKTAGGQGKILYWQDSMNPQYRSDRPGKAPDGMDLVPVYAENPATGERPPEGAFRITAEKQQLIGVQYGEVASQPLTKTIRAVANLTYDETRIVRVHSKIEGWADRVFVDFTGQLVRKDQPLLNIYSPELLATQDEYLLALRARDNLGGSRFEDVANGANSLVDAARRRLELWDITDQQIAEIERSKKPIKALTLFSPAGGFVLARNVYEKQRITPETELYSIADLSTIWAIADFYENEVHDVHLGQRVVLSFSSFPGRRFVGRVNYIYPKIENTTRTLRVRAEFPNPDFRLKPDMYADAELKIDYGHRLAVPQEAVLDSGAEQVVYVALGDGYFEPRKVVLGDRVDNKVVVLSGLRSGERVVTSGNFLIDSESALKAATSGMGMPGTNGGAGEGKGDNRSPEAPKSPGMPSMDHPKHQMKPEHSP